MAIHYYFVITEACQSVPRRRPSEAAIPSAVASVLVIAAAPPHRLQLQVLQDHTARPPPPGGAAVGGMRVGMEAREAHRGRSVTPTTDGPKLTSRNKMLRVNDES